MLTNSALGLHTASQYVLLLVLAVNSDWFQILRSYTLLFYLPILVRSCSLKYCIAGNSGKFLLVQYFAKIPIDSSEDIFIFAEQMRDPLTAPLPVDGHAPHANQRNKLVQQRPSLPLV